MVQAIRVLPLKGFSLPLLGHSGHHGVKQQTVEHLLSPFACLSNKGGEVCFFFFLMLLHDPVFPIANMYS